MTAHVPDLAAGLASTRLALRGRVVTMDAAATVIPRGVVYLTGATITAVAPAAAPVPAGFEDVAVIATGGTLYPGLIELHNHLPYDVLPLWQLPKLFTDRDQWSAPSTPDYRRLVSGPMGVLGRNPDVVPAIIRFVEMRCLLGGTTTSQGVALAVRPGIVKLYRGLVRNVESTGDPLLPPAATHIADVDATDAERFLGRISGSQKLLLHLSEGTDAKAREHFLALEISQDRWAITSNLIGIHCVALTQRDFGIFAGHGGSMVWSPLSNLLLYGKTADVAAAQAEGVSIALGSDWSPSGSKNLLGELKVARLVADLNGVDLSDRDLVGMATTVPARLLGWDAHLGSLEAGKKADLVVVSGKSDDPYRQLLRADEPDVQLVVIDGVPRAGTPSLMRALGVVGAEEVRLGRSRRSVQLAEAAADPTVAQVSVGEAVTRLSAALQNLPNSSALGLRAADGLLAAMQTGQALLAVAGVIDNGMSSRPHLPYRGRLTGSDVPAHWSVPEPSFAAPPPPLPALRLDPLTAAANPGYFAQLGTQPNLPEPLRRELAALAS